MISTSDKKRVVTFLAFAFGIAWLTSLVVYLNGGLAESPILIPTLNLSLALVLLATGVMGAPAIANILTRIITKEGKQDLWLKPARFTKPWRYWALAWVLPAIGTLIGAAVFYFAFPASFDRNLENMQVLLSQQGASAGVSLSPWILVLISALQAILMAPFLNGLPTFGEEFGWRGYLLPKLLPLGARKAVLLSGLIWGVWHWPIIAMGHNYGTDYFGAPWLGMLAMAWFTVVLGAMLSWLTLKEGSVWPAVIGHAAINGIAGLGLYALKTPANPLLGPAPTGLVGGIAFTLLALLLWLHPRGFSIGQKAWQSQPIIAAKQPIQDESTGLR